MIYSFKIHKFQSNFQFFQSILHLQRLECSKDTETEYFNNTVCELKTLKKGLYGITGYTDIVVPLTYIHVDYKLLYLTSNQILFNYTFEYCSSYGNLPPFLHIILEYVKTLTNDFIHACPYVAQKQFGLKNFPFDANTPLLTIANFQRGEYKSALYSKDKKGNLVIYVNIYFSISQKRAFKKAGSG